MLMLTLNKDIKMAINVTKMHFRHMKSFKGQHSFWMELGGFARVAIADQSIMGREGFMFQPQHADHGLLFVDFHTLAEKKYAMPCNTMGSFHVYALPVIDTDGEKFVTILTKPEYNWFMDQWGNPKKAEKKEESILEDRCTIG